MHSENKPTAKQLLASWQRIWTKALNGRPGEIKEAIASHVRLFPNGTQSEVRLRAERLIASLQSNPDSIRALLQRGQTTMRRI